MLGRLNFPSVFIHTYTHDVNDILWLFNFNIWYIQVDIINFIIKVLNWPATVLYLWNETLLTFTELFRFLCSFLLIVHDVIYQMELLLGIHFQRLSIKFHFRINIGQMLVRQDILFWLCQVVMCILKKKMSA